MWRGWRLTVAGLVLLTPACTTGDTSDPPRTDPPRPGPPRPGPPRLDPPRLDPAPSLGVSELPLGGWRRDALPGHRGWRPAPRAITRCGGRLLVLGAEARPDGSTRPAAWLGRPGRWRLVAFTGGDLYARQALLTAGACRGRRVVAVGAKSGGAHFLPRTSTWVGTPAGGLVNVPAPSELYGGPRAISIGTLAAGSPGFLLAGTRLSGAVVWRSADGREFTVQDGAPGLAGTGDTRTVGQATAHADGAWVLVGGVGVPGDPGTPAAWSSADGLAWMPEPVESGDGYGTLELVVPSAGGALAIGLDGPTFRLWERRGGRWSAGPRFAQLADSPSQAAYVTGLCHTRGGAVASVADGRGYQIWLLGADATRVPTPERVTELPSDGDTATVGCGWRDTLVLATDDGARGALWTHALP